MEKHNGENLKRIFHKILYPGTAVVVISVPAAAALLIYTFAVAGEDSPIAYVSYVFSAYALVILCTGIVPAVRKIWKWLNSIALVNRFLKDIPFRLNVSLHLSLCINLLYAGMNALSGILYRSIWFGTLAVYYIFLTMMRFLLVRYAHKNGFGKNMDGEWRRYRLCGIILVMMNASLSGVVVMVLHEEGGFHYAGTLIYAMALYAFYTMIMAVINVIRYRRYHSPVMSAAKVINLAAALVSMLSLETAMLTQFNNDNTAPWFRQVMVGSTGIAVSAIVIGAGLYMIVHASRKLKEEREAETKAYE